MRKFRQLRRVILRAFGRAERPAAWILLIGGAVTFVSVLVGIVVVGDARLVTLLAAAELVVAGFGAVQEAEDEDDTPT